MSAPEGPAVDYPGRLARDVIEVRQQLRCPGESCASLMQGRRITASRSPAIAPTAAPPQFILDQGDNHFEDVNQAVRDVLEVGTRPRAAHAPG